jgi:hypothetical protein
MAGYELSQEKWILNHSEYPLEVKIIPGRGRCVLATKEYHRGDIILKEEVYGRVVHHYLSSTTCSSCGRTPKNGQIYGISPDDPQRYCSQQCLTNDSLIHSAEVKALKLSRELGIDGGMDPCNLLIRIAAMRKYENASPSSNESEMTLPILGRLNKFSHVMSLEAASSSLSDEIIDDIRRVAEAMSELICSCDLVMTPDEAYKLLLIIQCNAHRIKSDEMIFGQKISSDIGLGLFPFTSLLNHSCAPNCFHSYDLHNSSINITSKEHIISPPTMIIRALCDIHIGDEICYNYIPLYQSTETRQGQLSRAYCFTCMCQRCQDNSTNHPTGDSNQENLVTCSYPSDHVLSLPTIHLNGENISPYQSSTEVLTCHSLLTRSIDANNRTAINSILNKLISLCSNEAKMSIFHPSNEILLTAYQTISLAARYLLNGASKDLLRCDYLNKQQQQDQDQAITIDEQQDAGAAVEYLLKEQKYCLVAIGFSSLALGSILHFTKVRNNDTGQYEELIGWSLYRLQHLTMKLRQHEVILSERSHEQQELNHQLSQLFITSSGGSEPQQQSGEQFMERMTILTSLCLRSCHYYWEGDPRVTELFYAAFKSPSQCSTTTYHQESAESQQQSPPLYEAFISSSQVSIFSLS